MNIMQQMMELPPNNKVMERVTAEEMQKVNSHVCLPSGRCTLCNKGVDTWHIRSKLHDQQVCQEALTDHLIRPSQSGQQFNASTGHLGFQGKLTKHEFSNYWGPNMEELPQLTRTVAVDNTSSVRVMGATVSCMWQTQVLYVSSHTHIIVRTIHKQVGQDQADKEEGHQARRHRVLRPPHRALHQQHWQVQPRRAKPAIIEAGRPRSRQRRQPA
jgi:hypothetical protein